MNIIYVLNISTHIVNIFYVSVIYTKTFDL